MLNENIKTIRKSKGLSQQNLADKLHVVRQTVSKWERGLSVPDTEMLISISEALEVPVSTLLQETVSGSEYDGQKEIAEKSEILNLQREHRRNFIRKMLHWMSISLCVIVMIIFAVLVVWNSPYLSWDYSNPETAVAGVLFHGFEWLFVRTAPLLLIAAGVGIILTRKRRIRSGKFIWKVSSGQKVDR